MRAIIIMLFARRCTSSVTLRPPRATRAFKTRGTAVDFDHQNPGVYCGDEAAERYLANLPGLNDWSRWHESPPALRNGHAHTIFAAKCRFTARVTYAREFIDTPDGGTLALDVVVRAEEEDVSRNPSGATFVKNPATTSDGAPFLVLLSGLGGGSQDTYVRGQAAAAHARGWRVAVLNMRSCAESPVTSPRFFSARRGSTDDVRAAVDRIRETYGPSRLCAIGWSNSGTIVTNALAEQGDAAGLDAACCLAAPLDMPTSSANLEKPFHKNVYDRSIGGSLAEKVRGARDLFLDDAGRPKAVPAWGGGTFVADVDRAADSRARSRAAEVLHWLSSLSRAAWAALSSFSSLPVLSVAPLSSTSRVATRAEACARASSDLAISSPRDACSLAACSASPALSSVTVALSVRN